MCPQYYRYSVPEPAEAPSAPAEGPECYPYYPEDAPSMAPGDMQYPLSCSLCKRYPQPRHAGDTRRATQVPHLP